MTGAPQTAASTGRATALPGIAIGDRPAASRPDHLLGQGSLLLEGAVPDTAMPLRDHRRRWGESPVRDVAGLAATAEAGNLLGAGGAAFPTASKLRSLAGEHVAAVVVNGCEGESASAKDGILLRCVPHLVLDGAEAVARSLGTTRVVIRTAADRPHATAALAAAVAERDATATATDRTPGARVRFEVSTGPASFVAGEASAVIRALAGGPALPIDLGRPPRLPGRLRRRHVFLSNAETFARLAVATRGDRRSSALVTVSGAVARPGVVEVPGDVTLGRLAAAVGLVGVPSFLITGGWHGTWLPWPAAGSARLNREGLAAVGGRWGAGTLVWLPDDLDPREVLAAIVAHLATASAGQCGPCRFGLPELSAALARASGAASMPADVERLLSAVAGRGLCAHPTATAAAVRSGWAAIAAERGGPAGERTVA